MFVFYTFFSYNNNNINYNQLDMQFVERMHEKVLYDLQFKPETFESERNTKLKSLFNDLTCVLDQPVKGIIIIINNNNFNIY